MRSSGALGVFRAPLALSPSSPLSPFLFLVSSRTPHSSHSAHLCAYLPLGFAIHLSFLLFLMCWVTV